MYSKKINQLATNLNPQIDDLLPIGDSETGQLKTTTYGGVSGITGDGVISGGIVTWTGTGLVFNISACTYILNGIRYTSPLTQKTLAAADPTNPRIDVFAVNTSGQVEVIQGTPNANPIEPEGDTATTLGLTNVTINAGATTPNNVTRTMIYDENLSSPTEWSKTATVSVGSYNFGDTSFAYTGTKSILITQGAGFTLMKFSVASELDISSFKSISFAIRLNDPWIANQILAVTFYNGTNQVSNTYQLNKTNTVGFNRNTALAWQFITIPLDNSLVKFKSNKFTEFRILTLNDPATYRIDTISINGGINNPGGTSSTNSFGFVNGSSGTASSDQATDTLNVVGSGIVSTSATAKTLTIATPNISTSTDSVLKLDSTTKGFLPTRMTETQKNAISTPSIGLMIYQTDGTEGIYQYKSTGWTIVGGGSNIYTTDGTLSNNRTLTHGGFNLTFVGSTFTNIFTSAGRLLLGTISEGTFLLDVKGTGIYRNTLSLLPPLASTAQTALQIFRNNNTGAVAFSAGTTATDDITFNTANADYIFNRTAVEKLRIGNAQTTSSQLFYFSTTTPTGTNINFAASVVGRTLLGIDSNQDAVLGLGNANFRIRETTSGNDFFNINKTTGNIVIEKNTAALTTIASAKLAINSTTAGFLPPRMTTTQKNAITSPVAGLIVYDTTDNKHYGYNGTTWNAFF